MAMEIILSAEAVYSSEPESFSQALDSLAHLVAPQLVAELGDQMDSVGYLDRREPLGLTAW